MLQSLKFITNCWFNLCPQLCLLFSNQSYVKLKFCIFHQFPSLICSGWQDLWMQSGCNMICDFSSLHQVVDCLLEDRWQWQSLSPTIPDRKASMRSSWNQVWFIYFSTRCWDVHNVQYMHMWNAIQRTFLSNISLLTIHCFTFIFCSNTFGCIA